MRACSCVERVPPVHHRFSRLPIARIHLSHRSLRADFSVCVRPSIHQVSPSLSLLIPLSLFITVDFTVSRFSLLSYLHSLIFSLIEFPPSSSSSLLLDLIKERGRKSCLDQGWANPEKSSYPFFVCLPLRPASRCQFDIEDRFILLSFYFILLAAFFISGLVFFF